MKLIEALTILRRDLSAEAPPMEVTLACGFTPLHLSVFLDAQLRIFHPHLRPEIRTGLFGDLLGTVEGLLRMPSHSACVVVEWPDFDPRLGLRQLGGWMPGQLSDIVSTVEAQADRLHEAIRSVAELSPIAVCLPTLQLPPVSFRPRRHAGTFETDLEQIRAQLAARLARARGVRLLNREHLDALSPIEQRRDVKGELTTGFPYSRAHASILAELLARLLSPALPKKGLVTDLDDTLWRGIVGDVGVEGIRWGLDGHSQIHGLYQQLLRSLGEAGILIAVASKNSPEVIEAAFRMPGFVLPRETVFPMEVSWNPKSDSISRILNAWNISSESVIFVDDSALELAEVQAAHPDLECLRFPIENDSHAYEMLGLLRDRFGKEAISREDGLRRESLRRAAEVSLQPASAEGTNADSFLSLIESAVVLDYTKDQTDRRALELINKTNQFNLNGMRYTEAQWTERMRQRDFVLLRAAYSDKFGSLGTIAVIAGQIRDNVLNVTTWVMSCRAFSRRIEHRCLEQILERLPVERIVLDYRPTPRNAPLTQFLHDLLGAEPEPGCDLTRSQFLGRCPTLFHRVTSIG
jgi:FkbH-like protein